MGASLRGSINAKCRDCIYDPKSGLGNWRQQVSLCTVYKCPLWPVRPVSESVRGEGPPPTRVEDHRLWQARLGTGAD
jgi:hypothetical protein